VPWTNPIRAAQGVACLLTLAAATCSFTQAGHGSASAAECSSMHHRRCRAACHREAIGSSFTGRRYSQGGGCSSHCQAAFAVSSHPQFHAVPVRPVFAPRTGYYPGVHEISDRVSPSLQNHSPRVVVPPPAPGPETILTPTDNDGRGSTRSQDQRETVSRTSRWIFTRPLCDQRESSSTPSGGQRVSAPRMAHRR
jgi:hypothetical protein